MIEVFKKYQPQKAHISIISHENHEFCLLFLEIIAIIPPKNGAFKNDQPPRKFIFPEFVVKNHKLYQFYAKY